MHRQDGTGTLPPTHDKAISMSENLVSIVYFSHAKQPYDDAALLELLRVSRRNNSRNGVTGILLYHDGNFAQVLEGPREAVVETFRRIGGDPAHDGIIATAITPLAARQFPEWSMGFLPADATPEPTRRMLIDVLRGRRDIAVDPTTIAGSLLKAFRDGLPHAL